MDSIIYGGTRHWLVGSSSINSCRDYIIISRFYRMVFRCGISRGEDTQ